MTDHNTNSTGNNDQHNTDDAWESFISEHADEFSDVEQSRTAKKFNRRVRREEKQTVVSVNDLDDSAFVGSTGPRDYTRSSWLDTDDIMDRHSAGFIPPNPSLRKGTTTSRLIFGILAILGIIGVILAAIFSAHAGWIGALSALCIFIGAGGLLLTRSPNPHDFGDEDADNGARV